MKKRLEFLGTDDENWQFISLLKLPKGKNSHVIYDLIIIYDTCT